MTCAPSALIAVLTALVLVALSCCMCCPCAGAFQLPPLQRLSLSQQRITRHTLPIAAKLVERGLAWHGGCWTCASSMLSSSGRSDSIVQSSSISVNSSCINYWNNTRATEGLCKQEHRHTQKRRLLKITTPSMSTRSGTASSAATNRSTECRVASFAAHARRTSAWASALRVTIHKSLYSITQNRETPARCLASIAKHEQRANWRVPSLKG